ncbi:hypothetical protein [Methylococcus sp. EFPC2]|uniref:hypothetical protein n=1 Tax=Methylococcus sp. EFPC2 TaxID=2812648 RepID=UPI0019684FD0|nr:hypothetical protein [Methylococcus sp. EFPC2]QSA96856.1 hypothetical protein JWZ97_16875 [Methylococcus sp. EFPC2]
MNMNAKFVATYVLSGLLGSALAAEPPGPPDIYSAGPAAPFVVTNLYTAERAAYALLEAAMQIAAARIMETSCSLSVGVYDVFVFSDGSVHKPDYSFVVVDSPASTFTLMADLDPPNTFRGQRIAVNQSGSGSFKKVVFSSYTAKVSFNSQGTIMAMDTSVSVINASGLPNAYSGKLIEDYYQAVDEISGLPYVIDWGLQSFSKIGYPVQKYWQRSKSVRDNSVQGRTVFVKDRLVGPTSCRIVIDTHDYNNPDYFYQSGTLTISTDTPYPGYQFDF